MLAGVAATGDEEVFSIISAGIFSYRKYPTKKHSKLRSTGAGGRAMNICSFAIFKSPLSPLKIKKKS